MNEVITLSDYLGGGGGWGQISGAELADLNKALTTSEEGVVTVGSGGGEKLRLQSLENTISSLTYEIEDMTMWNMIPKRPAYSTTEEFDRKIKHGAEGYGDGTMAEIDTAQVSDQIYSREAAFVRFYGVKKETSIWASMVKNLVDPQEEQIRESTIDLTGIMDTAIFWGDDRVNPQSVKGLRQQTMEWVAANANDAELIIDCKGGPLTPQLLNEGVFKLADRYGRLTNVIMSPQTGIDLSEQMLPKERYNSGANDGYLGNEFKGYKSPRGKVDFNDWVFLRNNRGLKPAVQAKAQNAPGACTAASATAADLATSSLALSTTYYYWVAMLYNGRESGYYAAGNATTDGSKRQQITLELADAMFTPVSSDIAAQAVRVYRSTVNDPATASWLADVPRKKVYGATHAFTDGAADVAQYVDVNQNMENTTIAYGIQNRAREVWEMRQLAPIMKLDLAIVATSRPFMSLCAAVPILKNPRRAVLYTNIGLLNPTD